jgi:hypothetical protein
VPLFGPDLVVAPGGRWVGALVLLGDASSPKEWAARLGGNLTVSVTGIVAGGRAMEPQQFTLPLDGHADSVLCEDGRRASSPDACRLDGYHAFRDEGPCVQLGIRSGWDKGLRVPYTSVAKARWIGGTRVTDTELDQSLHDLPESRALSGRARTLRAASYALAISGVLGSALTAAAIAGADRSREAPAGLSVLGVSAVGAILGYLAVRTQDQAIRAYNREAFKTGACAAPL